MYVTAHRVRGDDGREAIHGFLHRHGETKWPDDVSAWPETNPGELVLQDTTLPLGGNRVRSYLDLLVPDDGDREVIEEALTYLSTDLHERLNPTVLRRGLITLRFGVEFVLEEQPGEAYAELAEIVRRLLISWRGLADDR